MVMELEEQVKAYTAWINSQLKKRSQHITDLSQDLCDGVALATVVEIISGQELNAIQPKNRKEKEENLIKIFNFMKNNGIQLHLLSVEEIISGNVKAIMQLILALAAHFKPASIKGRKHTYTDKMHRTPTSNSKQKWKNYTEKDINSSLNETEQKLKLELDNDLSNVRALAENLQKILLEELDNQPIEDPHPYEESMILQAKLDQSLSENQRLQNELEKLQTEIRNFKTEQVVVESRLRHHEQEILSLRQELSTSSMEQDRLKSEKAEISSELDGILNDHDRFVKKIHKKDILIQELEHQVQFAKAEQAILISKKDKEIAMLQQQIRNSNSAESVFQDASLNSSISNSPHLNQTPISPRFFKSSNSPRLSRRSPVSKSTPRKSRSHQKQSDCQTKILYFTDKDMKPAMTTLAKRVGDITLEDFKIAIKKEGSYRYVFKALDPELGTVKEEVYRDDDIIPGWEGKIVAWVEEEVRV